MMFSNSRICSLISCTQVAICSAVIRLRIAATLMAPMGAPKRLRMGMPSAVTSAVTWPTFTSQDGLVRIADLSKVSG